MGDVQVPADRDACDDLNPGWQPGDPIAYINPEAPAATVPPYRGERYEALVPDTFDVAERARQVINPLTEATDANADREIYCMGVFCVKPALLCHGVSDANVQPKFQLTVPLMRMISGSDQNLQVEADWLTRLRRCIGPDGLFYLPLRGRPWEAISIPNWIRSGPGRDQYLNPFAMGMTLAAMTLLARRDSGEEWSAKARAMVDGLIDLAVDEGGIAYFWPSAFRAVKERPAATEPPVTEENGEACRLPYGLVHAYRLLGHEPALTMAGKNLRYLRRYFFREDGSFLREPGDDMTVHFHEHTRAILTMLEYAASAGDDEMTDFALRSFEWVRNLGVHPQGRVSSVWQPGGPGGPLVGYFPEFVNSVQLAWDGRYARVGRVGGSDRVTLTFPIRERTDVVYVEKHRYVLTRRGNDVVDIDPPGRYCPVYQRRHYRDGQPRLRAVTRFVSSENVDW